MWSSDGRSIAFVSEDESNASLWIVGTDAKDPRRLSTHTQIGVVEWQRRGKMIAFEALDNGQWAIWIARENGTLTTRLPCSTHHCRYPSWSSDSLTVFYVTRSENISEIRANVLGEDDRLVELITGDVRGLSVSSNGEYVAFVSNAYTRGDEWGLWAVRTSGKTIIPIITPAYGFNADADVKPNWSANGKNVMTIGRFSNNYQRCDLILAEFRQYSFRYELAHGDDILERFPVPFGVSIDPFERFPLAFAVYVFPLTVFTRVTGGRGIVSSFSPSQIDDSIVYTFSADGSNHLWVLLKAKPMSPYGT
jgi:dipeptidyl aminopeptidase/acylaminoacyl peptidase